LSLFHGDPAVTELVTAAERAFVRGDSERGSRLLADATQILVSRGEIEAAINICENARDYARAAYLAEQKRDLRRAAHLWFKAGHYLNSARVRLEAGEPIMAAELYEKGEAFLDAARIYEQQGDFVRSAILYERAGAKREAADLMVRALSSDGARRLFGHEAGEVCRRAGVLYAEIGLLDMAVRVLAWGGQNVFAGKLMARAGRAREAIDMLAQSGDYLAAAEVAREIGDDQKAHHLLGARAEMEGRLSEAAAHYEEAGVFGQAGRLYEYIGATEKAAAAYERAGTFETAAQLYERLGQVQHAVRCLRAAGREQEAAALGARASHPEDQIKSHLDSGDFLNAAGAALSLARAGDTSRYREAMAFLELVDSRHPDFIAARTMQAELLAEQGDNQAALRVLQSLFAGVSPGMQHLGALYAYGRLLELEGYLAGARNAYQTAAMFDPHYRDVSDRLQHLRESDSADVPISSPQNGVPTVPMVVGGPLPRTTSTMSPLPIENDNSTPSSPSISWIGPAVDDLSLEPTVAPEAITRGMPEHQTFDDDDDLDDDLGEEPTAGGVMMPSVSTVDLIAEQLQDVETYDIPPPPPELDKPFPADGQPNALEGVVLRGRFRIERLIGKGAQAHVYLARDQVLDRAVAIKVLNEQVAKDAEALERFLREARLAARVHHAGCIAIFDFGEERGLTFMAMEYFKGRTLKDLVKRKALNPYLAMRIARDVASALGAVHEAGIVHRDVKPTNVMVDRNGRVRLTDFGVASSVNDPESAGMMVGTMRYMAPEQARGKEVDARADIFSLGVMLYEMLAGKAPFGGTLDDLIKRVTKPAPPLPDHVKVPSNVHEIVRRCLERKPAHRYSGMETLISDLNEAIRLVKA
jgi:tRNA A-37 threonylcarbamoyl transferase component Bud32